MRLLTLFGILLTATLLTAQSDLPTQTVSIFKNGQSFFLKSGKVATTNGTYQITDDLPAALFGTFWFRAPDSELRYVTSQSDIVTRMDTVTATDFPSMLYANRGKRVKLTLALAGQDSKVYEGVIEDIENPSLDTRLPVFPANGYPVTVKLSGSWLTFRTSEVLRLEYESKPRHWFVRETQTNQKVINVVFNKSRKVQQMDMMYLRTGLIWQPNYFVELTDDDEARVHLMAEVTNDAEDIDAKQVNFVVGVPNFTYANRLAALVNFLSYQPVAYNQYNPYQNQLSNSIQSIELEDAVVTATRPGVPVGNGVTGTVQEDLFFYTIEDFELKKGGRGMYPIFEADSPLEHIYETTIPGNNPGTPVVVNRFDFENTPNNKTYHSIRLENETKFPWTTGTAMVVNAKEGKNQPIAQSRLKYTSPTAKVKVQLTEAPDIRVKHAEKVDNRVKSDVRMYPNNPSYATYFYDELTVTAKMKLKNFKNKAVDVELSRALYGNPIDSDVPWEDDERIAPITMGNVLHDLLWELTLKPGEEREITYSYKVYVSGR